MDTGTRFSSKEPKVNLPFRGTRKQIKKLLEPLDLKEPFYGRIFCWVQLLDTHIITAEKISWLADNEGIGIFDVLWTLDFMEKAGWITVWNDQPDWEEYLHRQN